MKTGLLHVFTMAGLLALSNVFLRAQTVSDFENISLSANSYKDGSGPYVISDFASGNVALSHVYSTAFGGYWAAGFTYSSKTDSITTGAANLYSARPASGYGGSANYIIGTPGSLIGLTGTSKNKPVNGMYVTNSTYAALSMREGDTFAKKFGGVSGNDPDFFVLIIKGYVNGVATSDSVNFYLADFRFLDNSKDYIVNDWRFVDLTPLGAVDSLVFDLASSDAGAFGINTPTYFCIDDIRTFGDTATFENLVLKSNSFWKGKTTTLYSNFTSGNAIFPNTYDVSDYGDFWSSGFAISNEHDTTTAGYSNLFSARTGKGINNSANYAVVQNYAKIKLTGNAMGKVVNGFYITNSTYAELSMEQGDAFAKKFGGTSGNDADWFKLVVRKWLGGILTNDSIEFYLADYRFADNSKDYIVKDWRFVDLTSLGNVDSLEFILSSSDVSAFGINTPAFFCMDNFTTKDIPLTVQQANSTNVQFSVYPNPANSVVNIDLSTLSDTSVLLNLTDASGKIMYVGKINQLNNFSLDLSSYPTGVYFLTLTGENTFNHIKLVKE